MACHSSSESSPYVVASVDKFATFTFRLDEVARQIGVLDQLDYVDKISTLSRSPVPNKEEICVTRDLLGR